MKPRWNVILDTPPNPGGCLKTGFRQVLKFFRVVADPNLDEDVKGRIIMALFFDEFPDPPEAAWELIEEHIAGPKGPKEGGEQRFDFNVDHGRLYASFWQAYGIDLGVWEAHWWQFLELFWGLPKDTAVMEVMELRGREIPAKGDAKYIRDLRRAKRAVALDGGDFSEEKASKLRDMMFKG